MELAIPSASISAQHKVGRDGVVGINDDERLGFKGTCDPANATMQWNLFSDLDPSPDVSNFLVGQLKPVFIVKSRSLMFGSTYTVRLQCVLENLAGVSQALVRLNQPPSGGNCLLCLPKGQTCNPLTGGVSVDVFDQVRLHCKGWMTEDSPLFFDFGLSYDNGATMERFPSQAKANFDIPCLNPGGSIVLFVVVTSSRGSPAVLMDGPGSIGKVTASQTIIVAGVRRRRRLLTAQINNNAWGILTSMISSALLRRQPSEAVLIVGGAVTYLADAKEDTVPRIQQRAELAKVLLDATRQIYILTPGIVCQVCAVARSTVVETTNVYGALVKDIAETIITLSNPSDLSSSKKTIKCGVDVAQIASSLISAVSALNLTNPSTNARGISEDVAKHAMTIFEPFLHDLIFFHTRKLVDGEDPWVLGEGKKTGRYSVERLSLQDASSSPRIVNDGMGRTASVTIPPQLCDEIALGLDSVVDIHLNTYPSPPAIGAWNPNASFPVSNLVGMTLSQAHFAPLHIANLSNPFVINIPLDAPQGLDVRRLECFSWNELNGEYRRDGCQIMGISNGVETATCSCHHLGQFMVAMGPPLPPIPLPPPPPPPPPPVLSPKGLMVAEKYVRYVQLSVLTNDKAVWTLLPNFLPSCDNSASSSTVQDGVIFVKSTATVTVVACRSGWVGGIQRSSPTVMTFIVLAGGSVSLVLTMTGVDTLVDDSLKHRILVRIASILELPYALVEISQIDRESVRRRWSFPFFPARESTEPHDIRPSKRSNSGLVMYIKVTPSFTMSVAFLVQKMNFLGTKGFTAILKQAGLAGTLVNVDVQAIGQDPSGAEFVDERAESPSEALDTNMNEVNSISPALIILVSSLSVSLLFILLLIGARRCCLRYTKRKARNKIADLPNLISSRSSAGTPDIIVASSKPMFPFAFSSRASNRVAPVSDETHGQGASESPVQLTPEPLPAATVPEIRKHQALTPLTAYVPQRRLNRQMHQSSSQSDDQSLDTSEQQPASPGQLTSAPLSLMSASPWENFLSSNQSLRVPAARAGRVAPPVESLRPLGDTFLRSRTPRLAVSHGSSPFLQSLPLAPRPNVALGTTNVATNRSIGPRTPDLLLAGSKRPSVKSFAQLKTTSSTPQMPRRKHVSTAKDLWEITEVPEVKDMDRQTGPLAESQKLPLSGPHVDDDGVDLSAGVIREMDPIVDEPVKWEFTAAAPAALSDAEIEEEE